MANWGDEQLFKSWQQKMSFEERTLSHTLHISEAKWIQKWEKNWTREQ